MGRHRRLEGDCARQRLAALEEQQAIWEDSLAGKRLPFTQTYVAYPGHSEHQTGLAIDLGRRSASIDFIRPELSLYRLCQTFRREMARYGLTSGTPPGKRRSPASAMSLGTSAMWASPTPPSWRPGD